MTLPTPYYSEDGVTIYHARCEDVVPHLSGVDALIADPPYGMAWNTDSRRFTGGVDPDVRRGAGRGDWGAITGDEGPFDPRPWLDFPRVVLWGANHYAAALPVGTTLVWIKKPDHLFGTFLSDCELAWMKGGYGVYALRKNFPPPSRMAEALGRVAHPSQKPVGLMKWCIEKVKVPEGGLVLDPYMGSGTTLRAAKDLGLRAIGVETEERYCEIAVKRLAQGAFDFGGAA